MFNTPVAFDVTGDAYDRFMGRYSRRLAPLFADFAGVREPQRVLDVGCGPGALTTELVRRVGAEQVSAVDPSPRFVAALRERLPQVEVQIAPGESLPHPDDSFDAAVAQLVVSFMRDAPAAATEMRRVVRPGGVVAACMWDARGGMELLSLFWSAANELDGTTVDDESRMRYRTPEELRELLEGAGLGDVREELLEVTAGYDDFDDFWSAIDLGVGPIGAYFAKLDEARRIDLRELLRQRLGEPTGAFMLTGRAWAVRGMRA